MTRWLWRLVFLAAVVAAGIWLWRVLFPGPEQVIRKNLTALARAACVVPNEAPMTKLANTLKVASFFTQDTEVILDLPGQSMQTIHGKDRIREAVGATRNLVTSLKVELVDVLVTVSGDRKSATVHCTGRGDLPGDSNPMVQEFKVEMQKVDGDWLISRAETVRTLR
jgi:ketosteroid isomerase-like protein